MTSYSMASYNLAPTSSIRSSFDAAREAVLNRPTQIPTSVPRPSQFNRYTHANDQHTHAGPPPVPAPQSLALALWASRTSLSNPTSILHALDTLPLAARPSFLPRPTPQNMYAPTHVKGRGWLSAYHDLAQKRAEEAEKLLAPIVQTTGGRHSTRLARPIVAPPPVVPLTTPTEEKTQLPVVRSHKSKAQQRARQAKLRAAGSAGGSRSTTPLPPPLPAKRKRGEDIVIVVEQPTDEPLGPRVSKRRKVVPDMPPPTVVPTRPPPKKTSSKDDGEAFVGEENEAVQKKSRPTRKAKEVSSIVEVDEEDIPVKAVRAPRAKKTSPAVEIRKVSAASTSTTTTVNDPRKSSTPPSHAYSTRRAMNRTPSTQSDLPLPSVQDKERTSPSGSDETVIEHNTARNGLTAKIEMVESAMEMERVPLAVA